MVRLHQTWVKSNLSLPITKSQCVVLKASKALFHLNTPLEHLDTEGQSWLLKNTLNALKRGLCHLSTFYGWSHVSLPGSEAFHQAQRTAPARRFARLTPPPLAVPRRQFATSTALRITKGAHCPALTPLSQNETDYTKGGNWSWTFIASKVNKDPRNSCTKHTKRWCFKVLKGHTPHSLNFQEYKMVHLYEMV